MKFKLFRRKRKISYSNPKVRSSPNPYFPGNVEQGRVVWKNRVFAGEVVLTALMLAYVIAYSPLFKIADIEVAGDPAKEQQYRGAVHQIVDSSRFLLIFPGGNYFFLRPGWVSRSLIKMNEQTTAFEAISITKVFPNTIKIKIEEKSVGSLWSSENINYGIDDAGYAIRKFNSDEALPALNKFVDKNNFPVSLNTQIISTDALAASKTLIEGSAALGLKITDINIPQQSCADPRPDSAPNTNSVASDTEINSNLNDNVLVAPEISEPCDPKALATAAHEMHAAIENGPTIYFLRENITTQIEKLRITLQDAKLDLTKLTYIDIRFGERVYYK